MIPFFAEELSNINVLRACISTPTSCNVTTDLVVKNNLLILQDQVIADLSSVQVQVSTDNLVVSLLPEEDNGFIPWEIKLTLASSKQFQQNEVKEWWTSRDLLRGNSTSQVGMHCQHCQVALLDNTINYKIKDLPSEHWYELVECWICHETKPEEHQARMRPILARPNVILVGTSYFLLDPQNLIKDIVQMDPIVLNRTNWDRGTLTKWMAINCTQCKNVIGEGQYYVEEDQQMKLLAVKLFKYCITLSPPVLNQQQQPVFIDYLISDLINTAKIHATHRFLIQGRQSQNIYALIWLFNWDTNIIHNNENTLKRERVMKVIYLDCTKQDDHTKQFIALWSNDKSTDHLIYPDNACQDLVHTLTQSTFILPSFMQKMNHPAMIFTRDFSIGFLHRSD